MVGRQKSKVVHYGIECFLKALSLPGPENLDDENVKIFVVSLKYILLTTKVKQFFIK